MKLVVDTNIVFSAVLNSNSRIARILIAGKRHFNFYSCAFLHTELLKHRPKLRTLTGLSSAELDEVIGMVTATSISLTRSPYRRVSSWTPSACWRDPI